MDFWGQPQYQWKSALAKNNNKYAHKIPQQLLKKRRTSKIYTQYDHSYFKRDIGFLIGGIHNNEIKQNSFTYVQVKNKES